MKKTNHYKICEQKLKHLNQKRDNHLSDIGKFSKHTQIVIYKNEKTLQRMPPFYP
jgi:hypothetical protein